MENTKIEWAHHTFNPWIGCTKVGPGCDNCYAEADFDKRRHVVSWGANQPRKRTAPSTWAQPLRWNAKAGVNLNAWEHFKQENDLSEEQLTDKGFIKPTRPRVFCASLADVFDNEVPVQWRRDLFNLILSTPNLDWLLLTKRIGNAAQMMFNICRGKDNDLSLLDMMPLPNVWIGATITNQEEADRDIPKLLAVPAAKRFLSMEPLLGPVGMKQWLPTGRLKKRAGTGEPFMAPHFFMTRCERCGWTGSSELAHLVSYGDDADTVCHSCDKTFACDEVAGIHWVIVGGESGPNARPMHPEWARSLRDQCQAAGVPFMFKQWGEWAPRNEWSFHVAIRKQTAITLDGLQVSHDDAPQDVGGHRFEFVGKRAAGRMLDGREWNEVPA